MTTTTGVAQPSRRKRLYFSWWGSNRRLKMPKYAVVVGDEAPITAIERAITNATGYQIISSTISDTLVDREGRAVSSNHELTLGKPSRGGGSEVAARVWVTAPSSLAMDT